MSAYIITDADSRINFSLPVYWNLGSTPIDFPMSFTSNNIGISVTFIDDDYGSAQVVPVRGYIDISDTVSTGIYEVVLKRFGSFGMDFEITIEIQ